MGSLFKSPKKPPPQPAPRPVTAPTPTITEVADKTDNEIRNESREQSLLRRNRGRLGTINTGFTGFLSPVKTNDPRKTLLGE